MGIPVRTGRQFSPADAADSTPVAIVDESFVRRYLPGVNPLGRKVRSSNDRTWREVVGVVGAIHQNTLETAAEPHLYVAARQMPSPTMTFVIRTTTDPRSVAGAVREHVRRIDPSQPLFNVRTLEDLVYGAVAARRFNARLVSLLAGLAGVLTLVGLYGMMSCWVRESRREIGVRMALGATRGNILRLLVRRAALPIGLGTTAGLLLAIVGARFLAGLLYGVAPSDPITVATALGGIVAATLAGIYLPARRALRVDPSLSLHAE
jgi:putative ABC transport system permease protein